MDPLEFLINLCIAQKAEKNKEVLDVLSHQAAGDYYKERITYLLRNPEIKQIAVAELSVCLRLDAQKALSLKVAAQMPYRMLVVLRQMGAVVANFSSIKKTGEAQQYPIVPKQVELFVKKLKKGEKPKNATIKNDCLYENRTVLLSDLGNIIKIVARKEHTQWTNIGQGHAPLTDNQINMVHELQQRMALVKFLEDGKEKYDEEIIKNYQIEEYLKKERERIEALQRELLSCSGSGQTTKITVVLHQSTKLKFLLSTSCNAC